MKNRKHYVVVLVYADGWGVLEYSWVKYAHGDTDVTITQYDPKTGEPRHVLYNC